MNRFLLQLLLLSCSLNLFAQKKVNHIYSDFNGWWSSGVGSISTTRPNGPHNLLAFRVEGGTTIFATGVNNDVLDQRGVAYLPTTYQSLPVRYIQGTPVLANTFVGLGKNYFNPAVEITGGAIDKSIPFYLTDGIQGLDLGTAVYNIPVSNIEYRVTDFKIAAINDGVPDIVATQMGEYTAGYADVFKFIDNTGATVGNPISVNFGSVAEVGEQLWAFFNTTAANKNYSSPQPGGTPPTRKVRLLSWDLHDFGLDQNNVGSIDRFVHTLSGVSDQAFMAYNTSSFSAESDLDACGNSIRPTLWLQANYGVSSIVENTSLLGWENRAGGNITRYEQVTEAKKPIYHTGSNTAGFNFNPYVSFNNQWMSFGGSAFLDSNSSMDAFIIARKNGAGPAGGNLLGISENNSLLQDAPALGLDANGNFTFKSGATNLSSALNPGQEVNLWRISYTRAGSVSIFKDGVQVSNFAGPHTFNMGTWHSYLGGLVNSSGNSVNNFDLAEMIVMPGNSTTLEKQKIETSLAIKYGFTLPYDFVSGSGTAIWNRGTHAFNNRVFGIGRENCFGLSQKQSQSEDDPLKMVQIGRTSIEATNFLNTASMATEQFLVFGDNNGLLTSVSKSLVKGRCVLLPQRIWRNQRTGTIINTQPTQVKIKIDEISWGQALSSNPKDFYLMIDRNSNGSFKDANDVVVVASTIHQGYAVFNNVIWDADGSGTDLFTVGTTSAIPCAVVTNPMIHQKTK